jgi:spore germination cell wall hydrolase CwlJ-like protein
MTTDRNELFKQLTDHQLLSFYMYGEARGEELDDMLAVGSVVINRVKAKVFSNGIKGVVLKPRQFSCFWERILGDLCPTCALLSRVLR